MTTPTTTDNALAYQHNHLIRTPLRMGLIEARIFIHALGHIHLHDTRLPAVKIPVVSIVGDEPSGDDYKAVHAACKALVRQILNVLPPDVRTDKGRGKFRLREVPLMAAIELDPGTGTIIGSFNDKARPYLLQLKETTNFTSANIQTLLTFTNPNSARLYWILLSYRNLDSPTNTVVKRIELDELKAWILTDATLYPVFAEFKRRILDPVAEDFARIGFRASWAPVRTGKKITALDFTIPKEKQPKAVRGAAAASAEAPASEKAGTSFDNWLSGIGDRNLQAAYAGLREYNKLTAATAQRIIRFVVAHPDTATDFYTTRYNIKTHNQPIGDMRKFTLTSLNTALGTDFK